MVEDEAVIALDLETRRVWTLIEALPGYPDNLAFDPYTGLLWIAIGIRRDASHDFVQRRPWIKRQIVRLPTWVWQHPMPKGLVLAVDEAGQVQHALGDRRGKLGIVTHTVPHEGWLYIGTLSLGLPVVRVPWRR